MRLRDSGAGSGVAPTNCGNPPEMERQSSPAAGTSPAGPARSGSAEELPHICSVVCLGTASVRSGGRFGGGVALLQRAGTRRRVVAADFRSVGFQQHADAHVFVARAGSAASADWPGRVEKGAILVLEGESPLAESFGFKRGKRYRAHHKPARRASPDAADHLGKGAGTCR